MNVTGKLVEFEKTIPERLAEPERRRSERIVTWSWRGQAAVGTVLIALVFVLDRSTTGGSAGIAITVSDGRLLKGAGCRLYRRPPSRATQPLN
ncbi:hypothetical protein OG568_60330 (plasmid) [Streptomyces sp. NBC_01450]|uniref:hypothetical protein n=1 Tax=Streptomyces sp. NBC_01450 TaxID=2903871 RepID=UPI002E34B281|nr:hypothetical protein [Streptomyces sp. NBC_01450]